MLKIYEKVSKTQNNLLGIVEREKNKSLIGEEPCLLCISAQTMHPKSVFGIIREGMRAARLRTTEEIGAGYDIKDFPVHFLGMTFQSDEHYKNPGQELAETQFFPLLEEEGKRLTEEQVKNKFRNINILTYCNGTETYLEAEKQTKKRMEELGYSQEEQNNILSQISVVAIATMSDVSEINASCTTFIDVNDSEIWTPLIESLQERLEDGQKKIDQLPISLTSKICYFNGSGTHSIKEYLLDSSLAKAPICISIICSLNNSLHNKKQTEKHPYQQDNMFFNTTLHYYNKMKISPEEIIKRLDKSVEYEGVTPKSQEVIELLNHQDSLCKTMYYLQQENEYLRKKEKITSDKLDSLVSTMSDTLPKDTYYDILVKGIGFQIPAGEHIETKLGKGKK